MARPQFSEILIERRRELGLSLQQASRVLKLKESVLLAFEEGDYESIPKSGYAQGMLASYARYLGLNPREIVDLFLEESYEYTNGTTSHELRRRTRDTRSGRDLEGYEVVNEADSRPAAYVASPGLLPTSGGMAGDMGSFATTSGVHSRSGEAVPLVGASRTPTSSYSHAEYVHGHAYNAPSVREQAVRSRTGQAGRQGSGSQVARRRSDIRTRSVTPALYTDDLRYDDRPSSYESSASRDARATLHTTRGAVNRPNVRRRSAQRVEVDDAGILGAIRGIFSDSSRLSAIIIAILGIVLTAIIITSVGSCIYSRAGTNRQVDIEQGAASAPETPVQQVTDTRVPVVETPTQEDGTPVEQDEAEAKPAYEEVVIEVTVAADEVSWLEINCDGEVAVSETVTGPWSETFRPRQEFIIQVGNSLATTVTKNGEVVRYDYKSSGVGTISIEGSGEPLPEESAEEGAEPAENADAAETTEETTSEEAGA